MINSNFSMPQKQIWSIETLLFIIVSFLVLLSLSHSTWCLLTKMLQYLKKFLDYIHHCLILRDVCDLKCYNTSRNFQVQPFPRRWDSKWSSECTTKSSMVITGLFSNGSFEKRPELSSLNEPFEKRPGDWPSKISTCISTSISSLIFSRLGCTVHHCHPSCTVHHCHPSWRIDRLKYRFLLQNIVSFIGLFCKRGL